MNLELGDAKLIKNVTCDMKYAKVQFEHKKQALSLQTTLPTHPIDASDGGIKVPLP
jgi:hypothetical protein